MKMVETLFRENPELKFKVEKLIQETLLQSEKAAPISTPDSDGIHYIVCSKQSTTDGEDHFHPVVLDCVVLGEGHKNKLWISDDLVALQEAIKILPSAYILKLTDHEMHNLVSAFNIFAQNITSAVSKAGSILFPLGVNKADLINYIVSLVFTKNSGVWGLGLTSDKAVVFGEDYIYETQPVEDNDSSDDDDDDGAAIMRLI